MTQELCDFNLTFDNEKGTFNPTLTINGFNFRIVSMSLTFITRTDCSSGVNQILLMGYLEGDAARFGYWPLKNLLLDLRNRTIEELQYGY